MELGIAAVGAITAIVYIGATVVKATALDHKWLPALCGLAGMALGLGAYYLGMPDYPAEDLLTAMAVGGVSGLAATGADQIRKQLTK